MASAVSGSNQVSNTIFSVKGREVSKIVGAACAALTGLGMVFYSLFSKKFEVIDEIYVPKTILKVRNILSNSLTEESYRFNEQDIQLFVAYHKKLPKRSQPEEEDKLMRAFIDWGLCNLNTLKILMETITGLEFTDDRQSKSARMMLFTVQQKLSESARTDFITQDQKDSMIAILESKDKAVEDRAKEVFELVEKQLEEKELKNGKAAHLGVEDFFSMVEANQNNTAVLEAKLQELENDANSSEVREIEFYFYPSFKKGLEKMAAARKRDVLKWIERVIMTAFPDNCEKFILLVAREYLKLGDLVSYNQMCRTLEENLSHRKRKLFLLRTAVGGIGALCFLMSAYYCFRTYRS